MFFREATTADIPQIQVVRNSVKENVLSDPSVVTDKDCEEYMTIRGKGWICEVDTIITGFAIIDLKVVLYVALMIRLLVYLIITPKLSNFLKGFTLL